MATMLIAAICPKCSEIRAKSKFTFQRGDPMKAPLRASDFEPVGVQPAPVEGEPSVCAVCNTALSLRPVPVETANGQRAAHPQDHSTVVDASGVTTLFAAQPGEEVKSMRELGPDHIVIITNRRILKINLATIAEELP